MSLCILQVAIFLLVTGIKQTKHNLSLFYSQISSKKYTEVAYLGKEAREYNLLSPLVEISYSLQTKIFFSKICRNNDFLYMASCTAWNVYYSEGG